MISLASAVLYGPSTGAPASAGHAIAAWLLALVVLLALIGIAVEVAMWRRFKEIKAMIGMSLAGRDATNSAIDSVRRAGEDTSGRVTLLSARVDRIDSEVQRLTGFHPPGMIPPKVEG
jgi:hypothetical protein